MKTFKLFLTEESDVKYMYHGTNTDNLEDIITSKKLKTFKPWHGTDQDSWPDGSTKKRSYWTSNQETTASFFPEGTPVVLRTKAENFPFKQERYTGDYYLEKDIPISKLEVLSDDNTWKPLSSKK